MEDKLFDTEEKRNLAIASMRNLKGDSGWLLVVSIIDANIEIVKEQILSGIDDETKESINRLRDRLKAYQDLKNTPDMIIKQLEQGEPVTPVIDPFQTVDQLREERKRTT
jgi:hypothetical protein